MTLAPLPKPPGANSLFLPLPTCVFVVPRTISHFGPLCFQQLAHSSAIRWGWGVGVPNFVFPISRFVLDPLYLLSFHILTNSIATRNSSTPLFSSDSKLFRKNTWGWASTDALSSRLPRASRGPRSQSRRPARGLPAEVGICFILTSLPYYVLTSPPLTPLEATPTSQLRVSSGFDRNRPPVTSLKATLAETTSASSLAATFTRKRGVGGPPPTPTYSDRSARCYNQGVPAPESATHRELLASPEDSGTRLDRFIAANCPELSRTRVQELIEAGLVLINGTAASKGSQHLHGGERITLDAPERPPLRAEPESIPLDILYEDDDVIAVNKAAGMTVHAGAGNHTGTLVNALLGRGQALARSGDLLRPGIVHRLDKETSGVILVAKNDFAHAKLSDSFRNRTVKKTYLALVQGVLKDDQGRIELAIGRDPIHRTRMAVQRKNWHGTAITNLRDARTDWRVLARIDNTTVVEVQLHTGRTHQIRVHFSAIKHPVVGDILYGAASELRMGKATLPPLGRNFLHAAKLVFAQPRTGAPIELRAPLPGELHNFLQTLSAAAGDDPRRIDAALSGYL
jgi:23S rRNA pseudouridine1911/1915/1917 synthase